jgi:hypothetical protein
VVGGRTSSDGWIINASWVIDTLASAWRVQNKRGDLIPRKNLLMVAVHVSFQTPAIQGYETKTTPYLLKNQKDIQAEAVTSSRK